MELAKNVLTLVAISAMLIEPIWCASISEQLDEEESLKALRCECPHKIAFVLQQFCIKTFLAQKSKTGMVNH